ncbi:MAG TPA: S46 family peptidase [Chitinophagaceae bacterium]
MKLIRHALLYLLLVISPFLYANEGMWLPQLLGQLNEKEMKSLGMKISAADIYNINKGSLKDAIVSFGGFCTAEVISEKGLILTNHHCGKDAIQNHSTVERNFLKDGFWAKNHGEELPNEGLTATFIVRIEDVTTGALKGVTASMDEKTRQSTIDGNIAQLQKDVKKEDWQSSFVRPFYNGNKYYLFVTEVFKDVRMVGAPPSAIGEFGVDTDNWVWPRHAGDFSLFRIYADKNNRPAAYSPQNVPYKPKRALSISLDGVQEGDFTMVFGFPGRTTEYLPASAVQLNAEVLNPVKIGLRDQALKILGDHMKADEGVKIQYAAKYASLANAWKKWQGESLGIAKSGALEKRRAYEAEFQKRVNANPALKAKYGTVLQELNDFYTRQQPLAIARDYTNEVTNAVEIFDINAWANALINAYTKEGEAGYNKMKAQVLADVPGFYKEFRPDIDEKVFVALMTTYFAKVPQEYIGDKAKELWKDRSTPENVARELYGKSDVLSEAGFRKIIEQKPDEAVEDLRKDKVLEFARAFTGGYNDKAAPQLNAVQNDINQLQRTYMQAQMEVFKDKRFYPDANSTLRVAYGQVKGYKARDAVQYGYYTYLDGVMEKYKPGDYEFDVPAKLVELYKKKDYGPYGVNGKMPVDFIANNHTTGGNSGSPVLDAYGNLIGLNFDRVWEGTMSDYNYDQRYSRNIMVDIRYVLFIVDKLGGAGHLVKEMKLVHPKKKV